MKQPNNKSKKKKTKKRNKKISLKAIIILIVIVIIILAGYIILNSDLFDIKKITVINNQRVLTEDIINTSGLIINDNMFKIFKNKIKSNIKVNPYIENVKVTKKLNGEIIIDVEERVPTYTLQIEAGYVYINNQGYILEKIDNPINLPIIKGYQTQELIIGGRLEKEDLEKLESVIKIMQTAENQGIGEIITGINIADKNNYILEIPSEKKTIEFGNDSDIIYKFECTKAILEQTKDEEGVIIVKDAVEKASYFREKV